MTSRDDMRITPQIDGGKSTPRERAAEERRTQAVSKRRRGVLAELRRVRATRRATQGRVTKRFSKIGSKRAAQAGLKAGARTVASRAIPVAGWALLLVDLLTLGPQLARRIGGGKSGRLVEAEDAQTLMGDLDNEAAANAFALGEIESDRGLLRAIGQDGKINSSIQVMINVAKRRALVQSQGADILYRDPAFDSKDTMLDKLLGKVRDADLKTMADTAFAKLRELGLGKIKTGR